MLDERVLVGTFVGTASVLLSGAVTISTSKRHRDSTSERQREPTFESPKNLHVGVAEGLAELIAEELTDALHVGCAVVRTPEIC